MRPFCLFQVMCKQLGFPSAQIVTEPGVFGYRAEDILKMDLTCIGNETTLAMCNKTTMEILTECDTEPVGIICNTGEPLLFMLWPHRLSGPMTNSIVYPSLFKVHVCLMHMDNLLNYLQNIFQVMTKLARK